MHALHDQTLQTAIMGKLEEKPKETNRDIERQEIRRLFEEYAATHSPEIKEKIVMQYMNLVRFLASKFAYRGEPLEDLIQVGSLALVKAIDRFDLSKGVEFTTYVTPTIVGEIKRHFRDKGWSFKVPRKLQELNAAVNKAAEDLTGELGHAPTISQIAARLGTSEEEVLEAQELGQAYTPLSLDVEIENENFKSAPNLLEYLGKEDILLENVEDRLTLQKAFEKLDPKEQLVLHLRFGQNLSQSEIAKYMHTLQMHISRLQARALEKLRKYLKEGK
jgi:RNA polymerase sigma-B factor